VRLRVRDNGPGMDKATQARVFEPFFTTKPVGEGTGLGLSVVHGIAQKHSGAIFVESGLGAGTTFTLLLPVAADKASPDRAVATPEASLRLDGGRHILYLDDDEAMLFLCARLFERRGHRVTTFIHQTEALAALKADPFAFDLLVTDFNMPGPSGLDVTRAALAIRADLSIVMASGFIDDALQRAAAEAGVVELILKASDINEFCETVDRLANKVGSKQSQG
jgi:CheY-like chemotaxis protein